MKVVISIMVVTIGILVFFIIGNDTINHAEEPISQQQSLETYKSSNQDNNSDSNITVTSNKDKLKPETPKTYAKNNSDNKTANYSNTQNGSNYQDNSSYSASNSSDVNNRSSDNQNDSNYANSSYDQKRPAFDDSPSSGSQDNTRSDISKNNTNNIRSDISKNNTNNISDEEENASNTDESELANEDEFEETEDNPNGKYQRLYDNGIMWSGNTGTLMVEYLSSHAQTTGIGFRVHFDSSSMRPVNVQQYPVDAIITTTAQTLMMDADNRDNDNSTNQFLPFAWASIYGQWPQSNQVNLATIEFEKVNGGSSNYNVNYSAVSVPAGFRLIK
jgi:hypothetical protein